MRTPFPTLGWHQLALAAVLAGVTGCSRTATGDRAFISETANASLALVNLDSLTIEKHVEVGLLPHGLVLSPDGRTVYTALAGSQAVAVVDVATATLRDTWLTAPVPSTRADGTVIVQHQQEGAASHSTCYACHKDGGAQPRYVGDRPVALRVSADGARLYVANLNSGLLAVLDTSTGQRVAAAQLAAEGDVKEPAGLELVGDTIWVSLRATQPSHVPGVVRRLDARTLEVLDEIPSGANPVELKVVPGRNLTLVTHFDADVLAVHDEAGQVKQLTVGNGPLGMALVDGHTALVAGYYGQALSLADLDSGQVQTVPLTFQGKPLANPAHAALGSDPRVAWVVQTGGDAHLLEVQLPSLAVTRALPIAGLSYDLVVLRGTHP